MSIAYCFDKALNDGKNSDALIVPLAQDDVMNIFLSGMNEDYIDVIRFIITGKIKEIFKKRPASLLSIIPVLSSARCGALKGCHVFQSHVSPTFALSQAFPASPTTWPYRPRARDRG